jgi:hypothetical protein
MRLSRSYQYSNSYIPGAFAKLSMGRTIPSFRIAAVLEENAWKQYRNFLNKKEDRTVFDSMFAVETLYNSASSYAAIPIRSILL